MSQKILVTGIAGFIGFHISKKLIRNGYKVIGIDNLSDYYDVELKKNRIRQLEILSKKHSNDFSNEDDDIILDIGPKTIDNIIKKIEQSNTVLWNGPAGYFENENFATGSYEIAKEISDKTINNKLFSVIGGGDTVAVLNKLNIVKNFNFVSTAGGAFLEYLEGKKLPGIKSLD